MVSGVFASALVSAALSVTLLSSPGLAAEPDPRPTDDPAAAALDALGEVRVLVEDLTSLIPGVSPDLTSDLTLALRDLALLKNLLPESLRPMAEGYLARPTDGDADEFGDGYTVAEETPVCSDVVCVHYVTTSEDRVPLGDTDANDVPDYVDFTLATMTHVHNTYVDAGYRAPKSDLNAENNGGDEKPDVYLANIGDVGFYGYCASDKDIPAKQPQATWGFCVLDNDYRKSEFPTNTPKENLEVTAAHEYFHDVQFGYDISEDGWVMEATATWAEDELFDDVDDNVQYLPGGPMALPGESIDQFSGGFHYGTWIFFRYLTERFRKSEGGMPILVRDLWRRLDDAAGGAGDYSLQGLEKVLRKRDLSLRDAFAGFSAANRTPGRSYDEGRANNYPRAPLAEAVTLTARHLSTAPVPITLDHLAAGTVRYRPGAALSKGDWYLRVTLDMQDRWKGSHAIVTSALRDGGGLHTSNIRLNKQGNGARSFGFTRGSVKYVEVTLVNASDKFRCQRGTRFSCKGKPKFDNAVERISARAFRA